MWDFRREITKALRDKVTPDEIHRGRVLAEDQAKAVLLYTFLYRLRRGTPPLEAIAELMSNIGVADRGEGRKELVDLGRSVPGEKRWYTGLPFEPAVSEEEQEEGGMTG